MPEPYKGVALNAPPQPLMHQARELLDREVAKLPPGTNGALIGIATDKGWNAAVVSKLGTRAAVHAWVGKDWGSRLEGGVAVKATW